MGWYTTRLYLANEAPSVTPVMQNSFFYKDQNEDKKATLTRGSTALASKQITGLRVRTQLALRFISEPMGITAPYWRFTGLIRGKASVFEGTGGQDRRAAIRWEVRWCSQDGTVYRNTPLPEFYDPEVPPDYRTEHPWLDSTNFRASLIGGWAPATVWTGLADVVPTDRLVIQLGFQPNVPVGEDSIDATLEYGEDAATMLSNININDPGWGFVDVLFYVAGGVDGAAEHLKPFRAAHRPMLLSRYETPAGPFGGTSFLGE